VLSPSRSLASIGPDRSGTSADLKCSATANPRNLAAQTSLVMARFSPDRGYK